MVGLCSRLQKKRPRGSLIASTGAAPYQRRIRIGLLISFSNRTSICTLLHNRCKPFLVGNFGYKVRIAR